MASLTPEQLRMQMDMVSKMDPEMLRSLDP